MSPSLPPPSVRASGDIKPMSVFGATGWTFLVTAGFFLLWSVVSAARPNQAHEELTGFMCQALAYLLGLFAILRLHGPDTSIRAFIGIRKTSAAFYPIALFIGAASSIWADEIYDAVKTRFPFDDGPEIVDILHDGSHTARILIPIAIALAGPFIEEIVFRGAFFRPLKRKLGPIATVVTTAVLFTLVHVAWQKFPPILIMALALGLLREWSGSMLVSFVCHAAFNGVGVVAAIAELNHRATYDLLSARHTLVPNDQKLTAALATAGITIVLLFLAHRIATTNKVAITAREKDA